MVQVPIWYGQWEQWMCAVLDSNQLLRHILPAVSTFGTYSLLVTLLLSTGILPIQEVPTEYCYS